jgi:hypothetical protein
VAVVTSSGNADNIWVVMLVAEGCSFVGGSFKSLYHNSDRSVWQFKVDYLSVK